MAQTELKPFILDARLDYRKRLTHFKLSRKGDLLFMNEYGKWEVLIPKERLTDGDWLSDMTEERGMNYAEFVKAYCLALEAQGIKYQTIRIFGFRESYKFCDE